MGTEQAVARALIFGSAPCGDWSFLAPYLAEGGWTVFCADGGVKNARHAGLEPDYLIGDWDSGGAPEAGVPSLTLPAEKDMTDLQAAAGQAIALGARTLLLCGCTAGGWTTPPPICCCWSGSTGTAGPGLSPTRTTRCAF